MLSSLSPHLSVYYPCCVSPVSFEFCSLSWWNSYCEVSISWNIGFAFVFQSIFCVWIWVQVQVNCQVYSSVSISLFSYCLLVLFSFVSSVLCVVLLLLHFHCILLSPPASYYPPVSNSLTAISHTDSAILPSCLS